MTMSLILMGTSKELQSPRALKVLVTAMAASIPLTRTIVESEDALREQTTPMAKSLVLTIGEIHLTTTNAMLRTIAELAPGTNLSGITDIDKAQVDGWLSFVWSSLDVTLDADEKADLSAPLHTLEEYLHHRTYLVGQNLTIADISLAVTLHMATVHNLCDCANYTNVHGFYETVHHQRAYMSAFKALVEFDVAVGAPAAAPAVSAATTSSEPPTRVLRNGAPTPVVHKLYQRHRIRIKEVLMGDGAEYIEKTITVAGWARTTRNANKGQLLFIELNDGSTGTSLQCVLDKETTKGFEACKASGGTGASFQMVGIVKESPASGQAVEMQVTTGTLVGAVYGGNVEGTEIGGMLYPMSKKEHTMEHMREHAHLRPRGRIHAAAMRVRHAMAYATHQFFHNHGFLYIHTPIITAADAEGAGEQFAVTTLLGSDHLKPHVTLSVHEPSPSEPEKELSNKEMKRLAKKADAKGDPTKPEQVHVIGAVDYSKDFFARRANLTVSGQLNVETHACALSDVYTFGPTFRAENSHTVRHLSEFWMIEPEIAFADLTDDINLAEDYLKYCVEFALDQCAEDLEFFENNKHGEPGLRDRLRNVLESPFKRITYTEAIEILQKAVADGVEFEEKPDWGIDLPSEHERYLCETVFKQPVVLMDYPKEIKAFYMKLNDDQKTVAAADILVPKIGEIIGGSQREHRRDVLVERCIESGLDPKQLWWYLDLRKYGTVPHAGFGLGFERLILFITGLHNIRDVIPFPRWQGNAEF